VILVDSSVWIDFFNSSPARGGAELRRLIEASEPLFLTGIVIAEILQGLTSDPAPIERFLAQFDILEPKRSNTYRNAAAIYRAARVKGISLTTIDTLIAAIALEHGAYVFTLDQDFARIARLTELELYRF